ncbi:MAG: thiamine pyrophosphate-dependent enzyme [Candidatus Nanoarchaeia archaeon]|nr:thiamine pyrophosphate-dependent enzyme [Candidatus Nanoarchaeia archaeon]
MTNTDELKKKLGTKEEITWCPGCKNFLILEAVKKALAKLISEGYKHENLAMATGIGCHQKIYDYININGIYGLHGRVIPTAYGMKLGNPNLTVIGFAGDGDAYAEGMEHFIHAGRFNFDMTYIVADNQNFALTTGQATPTSQQGYKNKAEPLGEFNKPFNPIKLALACGMSFIARCDPRDINHTAEIIERAIKHKGFAYIEMMQHCLAFNIETNEEDRIMYKVDNKDGMKKAMELADEWDYNSKNGKIPIGIIYQENRKTQEDEWPQLKKLVEKKVGWKNFKK